MKKETAQQISDSHKGFKKISKWPGPREQTDGKDSSDQCPALTELPLPPSQQGRLPAPAQHAWFCLVLAPPLPPPTPTRILSSALFQAAFSVPGMALIMKNKGYLFLLYGVGHVFASYVNT